MQDYTSIANLESPLTIANASDIIGVAVWSNASNLDMIDTTFQLVKGSVAQIAALNDPDEDFEVLIDSCIIQNNTATKDTVVIHVTPVSGIVDFEGPKIGVHVVSSEFDSNKGRLWKMELTSSDWTSITTNDWVVNESDAYSDDDYGILEFESVAFSNIMKLMEIIIVI